MNAAFPEPQHLRPLPPLPFMTEAGGGGRFDEHSLAYVLGGPAEGSHPWLDPVFAWRSVVAEEDWPRFAECVRGSVRPGGSFTATCRLAAPAGPPVLATVSGSTVLDRFGRPSWVEGIITPRSGAAICCNCREAGAQAESKARELSRNILSVLSHDIRSPLIGVIGALQLLRRSGLDERQAEYAELASQSCERILDMAKNLLDFARIDSGRDTLNPAPLDVAAVADSVTGLHLEQAMRHGVFLDLETGPGLPKALLCDETKLRQILGNLISNAIKFAPGGSVGVRLDHAARPDGTVGVLVSVTDTGAGFDLAQTPAMFDQFSQLCRDPAARSQGAGLGLAIVKGLVDLFGGSICADSAPGRGASFHVCLPCPPVSG